MSIFSDIDLTGIVNDIFKEDGYIADYTPGYKVRESQKEAAELLVSASNEEKHSIIEGPCGFGKTYVYLTTAILKAYSNIKNFPSAKDRPSVIIATSGISLQEQLINKDIPSMLKCLSRVGMRIKGDESLGVKAALMKGRQNYICPLKFVTNEAALTEVLSEKQFKELGDLKVFGSGDLSKLEFVLPYDARNLCVCVSQHDCKGKKCAMYKECPYQHQKIKALSADIIVCNYHVLFSALEAPLLPRYNMLIWDEAHEAPSIFREFKKESVSVTWLTWVSNMLASIEQTAIGKEIINQLSVSKASISRIFDLKAEKIHKAYMDEIGVAMSEYLRHMAMLSGISLTDTFKATKLLFDTGSSTAQDQISNIEMLLELVGDFCRILMSEAEDFINSNTPESEDIDDAADCFNFANELLDSINAHINIIKRNDADGVERAYYIKKDVANGAPLLAIERMPIDVGGIFHGDFIKDERGCVNIFTSATLSTGGNLEFFKSQLGLNLCEEDKVFEFIGESPFDLKNQELWYLPKPCVNGNTSDFEPYFLDTVKDLVRVSGKGMLILTTSITAMNRTHDNVAMYLSSLGRNTLLLKQNDLPRPLLLKKFREDGKAILVATKSFFTGIDIPGQALQILVIDKLPFDPPDDPVVLHMNTTDKNTFMEYSIPNMIITLKQAVGRGVRSVTDKCVICVTDGRMATARYRGQVGRSFNYEKTSTRDINDIVEFLNK